MHIDDQLSTFFYLFGKFYFGRFLLSQILLIVPWDCLQTATVMIVISKTYGENCHETKNREKRGTVSAISLDILWINFSFCRVQVFKDKISFSVTVSDISLRKTIVSDFKLLSFTSKMIGVVFSSHHMVNNTL